MQRRPNEVGTPWWQFYPIAERMCRKIERDVLTRSVRAGDILMARGWFPDKRNAVVKEIYQQAGRKQGP